MGCSSVLDDSLRESDVVLTSSRIGAGRTTRLVYEIENKVTCVQNDFCPQGKGL